MTALKLRLGTRGSMLALVQANLVSRMLAEKAPGVDIHLVKIRTAGDRLLPEKRSETDGKGAFTGDIEETLMRGELDLAVHSLKDLSVEPNHGLVIAATPPRGDPRDALVTPNGEMLPDLPPGAEVGTSSIRRKAQLLSLRKDLVILDLHGNVETRMRKMNEFHLGGIVLAAAGLDRLSFGERISQRFSVEEVVPSTGQGTIAVQVRRGNTEVERIVSEINDEKTMKSMKCETAFARTIGGDCNVAAGAYASINGRSLTLIGMIASPDGTTILKKRATSTDAIGLGESLGEELLQSGGSVIIRGSPIRA